MDRMRTGYIDQNQYKTGMITLGICGYNKEPPLAENGMVEKEFFVEEAFDCEVRLLEDMIRRRWIREQPPKEGKRPPHPPLDLPTPEPPCRDVCAELAPKPRKKYTANKLDCDKLNAV